ncbi:MAG: metal-sensitive transcriptional regulator [Candidatus Omnitrophota bacterium]|nr:metal-sensitive transcriptional regulator [Candidatus Omnitrophota bacterium]MBU1928639.1 metal-sensitive transcriptional regulator [Candidatus Omnitrophota bacterium]MBU2034743.1 metal-sensitive transcriptional regulator [Candidatus Omnitrophota bacterium]MBU2222081.1 metal-sensitive transcriptional regulator [Candidatus Omnitrophota bacterium]MBU2257667.1 metal-sensitive transcriptional regulator [Candidatus Omnitrophota bacterium]
MPNLTTHEEQLEFLKKIEGQVRGLQNMIRQKRYCVDIITQVHSVIGALYRVKNEIFNKHLESCVVNALKGKSKSEKEGKITEIIELIDKFGRF